MFNIPIISGLASTVGHFLTSPFRRANAKIEGASQGAELAGKMGELRNQGMNPTWSAVASGNSGQPVDSADGFGNSEIDKFTGNVAARRAERSAIQFDMANRQLDLETKHLKKQLDNYMPTGYKRKLI